MPTQEEIFSSVQEALIEALGVDDDEVTSSATLVGDLGAALLPLDFVEGIGARLGEVSGDRKALGCLLGSAAAPHRLSSRTVSVGMGHRRFHRLLPLYPGDVVPGPLVFHSRQSAMRDVTSA